MKKSTLGILLAFITNTIFGFSFIFSTMALKESDVFILLTWRFGIAFLLLLIIGVLSGKLNYKGKNLSLVILLGVLQPLLYFIFEQYGMLFTTTSFSGVMLALNPVFAMAISGFFLGEKPTGSQIAFGFLSLFGVSVISIYTGTSGTVKPIGILCLVLAVLCAAFFNIVSRKISTVFSPLERTTAMFAVGFVGVFAIATLKFKGELPRLLVSAFHSEGFLIGLLYLAVISSVVAYLLYNYATTYISVVQTTAFTNVTTVTSVLAGIFILKEDFGFVEIISCILIVIGVCGVNGLFSIKREKKR